jgi:hypothetical protein
MRRRATSRVQPSARVNRGADLKLIEQTADHICSTPMLWQPDIG